MERQFLIKGNPQNIPKIRGGNNMFFTASKEQIEQLYPDIINTEPEKIRFFYTHEDGTKRLVDRVYNHYFSDKPWGLETEYKTEGQDQEFVDDKDYLSLSIRNAIVAPDGWTFVSCDFAAQELRLGAINTKSKVYMKAFKEGMDVHLQTALAMFGEEAVKSDTKKYRGMAKGCNSVDAYYLTSDGYKKLKDTDHLLDLNGNKQKFIYTIEKRSMYRLHLSNGQIIDVTKNHKFKDMGMLYPEYKEVYEGMQIPLVKMENKKFSTKTKYKYTYTTNAGSSEVEKTYTVNLTKDLGYLIGLYLGDGYLPIETDSGYVRGMTICCNPSNADYVQSIMEQYRSGRKGNTGVKREESDKYVLLSFSNAPLLRFILEHFGRTTSKRVSKLVYSFPKEFNLGLLDGLLDSDGKVYTDNADFGVSSELLARSVADLISFLGLPAKWKESSYTYKDVVKPFYYVTLLDMRYTDLRVDYKRDRLNGKLNRYISYDLKDVNSNMFNGKYYDKLNMLNKGLLKVLTCRAIDKYIPTMDHNNYYPITIDKIENVEGLANIMECKTHYYIAEGFESPNCNFGLQYGGSFRVLQNEYVNEVEARIQYENYMLGMADHFAVQNAQVRITQDTLCEYSMFGLPVRLHNYYRSDSWSKRAQGERLARNHRIQATGADVMSIAYIKLWKNIFQGITNSEDFIRFQLSVHDEIDFIVRNDVLHIIVPQIMKNMQTQMQDWEIPLTVGLSLGPSFGSQYEYKYDPNTFKIIGPDMSPESEKDKNKRLGKSTDEKAPVEEESKEPEITLEF